MTRLSLAAHSRLSSALQTRRDCFRLLRLEGVFAFDCFGLKKTVASELAEQEGGVLQAVQPGMQSRSPKSPPRARLFLLLDATSVATARQLCFEVLHAGLPS